MLAAFAACFIVCGCASVHESRPHVAPECREITARTFAVLRVIDGDTFVVMYDGEPTSCRLYGIDTPERGEPGYRDARDELARLIDEGGGVVEIHFPTMRKRDNFGRLLVTATVGGVDLSTALRDHGFALAVEAR